MAHDPERQAAAFLGAELDPAARNTFSEHLVDCDTCWREVRAGQHGRALAESARAVTPSRLRERIRAVVLAEQATRPTQARSHGWATRRPAGVAILLTVAVAIAGAAFLTSQWARPTQDSPAFAAAVADFRAHELPGRHLPEQGAPDLSRLRLVPVGAGAGRYGELSVDGYAYRDPSGRRLFVYLSQVPFPTAYGATHLAGPTGPWTARRGDVTVLCARAPHALLVVGQDATLVRRAAGELGVL